MRSICRICSKGRARYRRGRLSDLGGSWSPVGLLPGDLPLESAFLFTPVGFEVIEDVSDFAVAED